MNRREEAMGDFRLEDLDERLRSRILAATAHAVVRAIRRTGDTYMVDARSGDRLVHTTISLRPDGSVAEATESFLAGAVSRVRETSDPGVVDVDVTNPSRTVTVAASVAATLEAPGTVDGGGFDELVSRLDYPMFIVTAAVAHERDGCLVGFACQASINPPRFLVCLSDKNRTYEIATRAEYLVLHSLGDTNDDLARLFGGETGNETDKFGQCSWRKGPGDVPVLEGTNGWVALRSIARHVVGDHVAFLGDVVAAEHECNRPHLGFQAVRGLRPGHAP